MTTETQYGYKIPELEDKTFWDSFIYNFKRLDQHDHDGENSTLLPNGSFAAGGVTLVQQLQIPDFVVLDGQTHFHPGLIMGVDELITVNSGGYLLTKSDTILGTITVEPGGLWEVF